MDSNLMWMILLQQQAAAAEAERQRQEAEARQKAQADAATAKAAQEQRLNQIANQRQQDALTAQQAEAERLASMNKGRAAPIAPSDAYSPIGGSFYGGQGAQSASSTVGDQLDPSAFRNFSTGQNRVNPANTSPLSTMMGQSAQPLAAPSARAVGGGASGGAAGFRMF